MLQTRIEIVNIGADTVRTMWVEFADLEAAHEWALEVGGAYWHDLQLIDDGIATMSVAVER